ncbi:MAG: radical SAM family heme chaperone HemW, partial [candidate division Zixibacteria bacterium]|nr:radical SAM family heme chaperone HemW [candidate division Zixibacteria bacterium]
MNNRIPNSPIGIYIHIPFCKSKCPYCDFYSITESTDLYDDFVRCLLIDIGNTANRFKDRLKVDSIYLGGGTPSLLETSHIADIIEILRDRFSISENAEISAEANPESVNRSKLKEIHSIGINRLSIGVQSFSDEDLKTLGRIHNSAQAVDAINSARDAGFKNISLDFMFNIPDQDISTVEENIRTAHELGIHHISYYGLTIEKGTVFDDEYKSGQLNLP